MSLGYKEFLKSAQIDGAANTAGTRASLLPAQAKHTFPAGFFSTIGQKLIIEAAGKISSASGTPGTFRPDVTLGGTIVFDGLAALLDSVATHTNVAWWLRIILTLRAVGSSANFMGHGMLTTEDLLGVPATAPKGCLTAMLPWNSAPVVGANFDATAAQQLDLFFTQTVATGSCTLQQFDVSSPTFYPNN
jgi:hypothetical protein